MKRAAWLVAAFTCALTTGCGQGGPPAPTPLKPPATPVTPRLDAAVIKLTPDDRLEATVMDYVRYKAGSDPEKAKEPVAKMSKGMQMMYATWRLESELSNGGFNQFFWNDSSGFVGMALEGYKAIGAEKHAALLQRALEMQKREEPVMREYKAKGTPDAFAESYKHTELGTLDKEFSNMSENTSWLRVQYIRKYPEQFTGGN